MFNNVKFAAAFSSHHSNTLMICDYVMNSEVCAVQILWVVSNIIQVKALIGMNVLEQLDGRSFVLFTYFQCRVCDKNGYRFECLICMFSVGSIIPCPDV